MIPHLKPNNDKTNSGGAYKAEGKEKSACGEVNATIFHAIIIGAFFKFRWISPCGYDALRCLMTLPVSDPPPAGNLLTTTKLNVGVGAICKRY